MIPSPATVEAASLPDNFTDPMLTALVLSVCAAQLSRRQLRRLKRRAMWSFVRAELGRKLGGKRDNGISNRTLLYILLGLAVLILVFVAPVAAIILLLIGILLVLLNR